MGKSWSRPRALRNARPGHSGQSAKLPQISAANVQVTVTPGRFARGALHQLLRAMTRTGAMHFFPQPFQEVAVFATRQLRRQCSLLRQGTLHDLGGVEIPQGVGGKITKHSDGPMDVLQAAVRVLRHFESAELFKLFIPDARHIGHLELAFDQLHFEFKAQQHVQIVSDLIRLHANERKRPAGCILP